MSLSLYTHTNKNSVSLSVYTHTTKNYVSLSIYTHTQLLISSFFLIYVFDTVENTDAVRKRDQRHAEKSLDQRKHNGFDLHFVAE